MNKHLIQGSPQWLAWRKTKIGASDASIISGLNPWATPFQLWKEKLGIEERESNESMKHGTAMEEEARQEYEKMTGLTMFPIVLEDKERSFLIASLDGMTLDRNRAVEIKCPMRGIHEKVKDYYYPQIQCQLHVSGLNAIDYFSYHNGVGKIIEVKRNDEYIKQLLILIDQFWSCLERLEWDFEYKPLVYDAT